MSEKMQKAMSSSLKEKARFQTVKFWFTVKPAANQSYKAKKPTRKQATEPPNTSAKTATANPSSFTQFSEEANLRNRKGE